MQQANDTKSEPLYSLPRPVELVQTLSASTQALTYIQQARTAAANIMQGRDNRLLVIAGPCSIHDDQAALDYAKRLQQAAQYFKDELLIVMRAYFEKPRTLLGWKGLISDPQLDGSFDICAGLKKARQLLLTLADLGLPAATEFLDTITPQYLSDLISWSAIGARTSESPAHRELASGLAMPVGFKNTTDGNIKIAIDAVNTAQHSHCYLGVSKDGTPAVISTKGNKHCHVILRGSRTDSNYDTKSIQETAAMLIDANLPPYVMVDCSHGNSMQNHQRQQDVVNALVTQLEKGSTSIAGVMLESHLMAGKQTLVPGQTLVYGQSITDACISWEETLPLLGKLADAVKARSLRSL